MIAARPSCFRLLIQLICRAFSLARANTGNSIAAIIAIGLQIIESVPSSARPIHLEGVDALRTAQPEVDSTVGVRAIAGAALHLRYLRDASRGDADLRANRAAVALYADELKTYPM